MARSRAGQPLAAGTASTRLKHLESVAGTPVGSHNECVTDDASKRPSQLPNGVDPRLWIIWGDPSTRVYLVGNSHTFPGRMSAYHPDGWEVSVSKFEILEASELAWAWIDGFLRGNEPSAPQDNDEEADLAWEAIVTEFRRTGDLPRPWQRWSDVWGDSP